MSASVWSEPDDAHPGLGPATISHDQLAGRTTRTPEPYYVLATDLKVGDRIRDRGDLHTISTITPASHPVSGSITVTMDDGASLGIPVHQHVTIWR